MFVPIFGTPPAGARISTVFLFVCWNKSPKNYTPPPVGREVNPLGVVTHGQRHKPFFLSSLACAQFLKPLYDAQVDSKHDGQLPKRGLQVHRNNTTRALVGEKYGAPSPTLRCCTPPFAQWQTIAHARLFNSIKLGNNSKFWKCDKDFASIFFLNPHS